MSKIKDLILNKFFITAQEHPDRIAIYHKENSVTYSQLVNVIKRIAIFIQNQKEIEVVALHLSRSPNLIAALFGCWHAGVPFVALDPRHPIVRKKKILKDFKGILVISDQEIGFFNEILIEDLLEFKCLTSGKTSNTNRAYFLYTSGSTGIPKGICLTDQNVFSLLNWAHSCYSQEELSCVLASTTITFDLSIFEIFAPLTLGKSICLVDSILDLVDYPDLFSMISLINTVPSAMREIVRLKAIPKSTKVINLAGEVLEWSLVNKIYQFPFIQKVYNLYGPSEDTTYSTYFLCPKDSSVYSPEEIFVPIGKSIPGSSFLILNDYLQMLQKGNIGEICLMGDKLAECYLHNQKLTDEKFILTKMGRIYRTGDLGFINDRDELQYKGRIDNQIKIRGYRVELEEIESHLLDCKNIHQALVVAINENGQQKLVAGIKIDQNVSQKDVLKKAKEYLTDQLPFYMLPQKWFVTTELLATTNSGKLSRKSLIDKFSQKENQIFELNEFEEVITKILYCQIDYKKSFIDHGGDSLMALRLLAECRKRWKGTITLKIILDRNTSIEKLKTLAVQKDVIKELTLCDRKLNMISEAEFRMWKVMMFLPDSTAYNVCLEFVMKGDFDIERFMRSCQRVVSQTPVFQYNYKYTQNGLEKIRTTNNFKIVHYLQKSVQQIRKDIYKKPFDLEKDLLIRMALVKNEDHYILLFSAPHIVIDGLGIDALFKKISSAYENEKWKNQESKSYHNYDLAQKKNEAIAFWKNEFKIPIQNISWPGTILKSPDFDSISRFICKKKVCALQELAKKNNVTFPLLLLAAIKISLYRMHLGDNLVVGCTVANRMHNEQLEEVANYTNTLPLRTQIHGETSLLEFIQKVYQKFLAAIEYQEVSIDIVLGHIFNESNVDGQLFDIIFSYMNFGLSVLNINGVESKNYFPISPASKTSLVISAILQSDDSIEMRFEYLTDRLPSDFVDSLAAYLLYILESMGDILSFKIHNLFLLPPEQIKDINNNIISKVIEESKNHLALWIKETAMKNGNKIAIDDHKKTMTYSELWESSIRVAKSLRKSGVSKGEPIALSMEPSLHLIVAIVGILAAGCYYVPLDHKNPISRNQFILINTSIKHGITQFTDDNKNSDCEFFNIEDLLIPQEYEDAFLSDYTAYDPAYVIYTSGTTGKPKGVLITHSHVATLFQNCQHWCKFSANDVWTLFHSYAFDFSVWEIFGALLYGGKLIIVSSDETYNPKKLISLIEQNKITIFNQTPTSFKNILMSNVRFNHLPRMIIFGGEALYPDILNPWWKLYGSKTKMVNMYGITEVTIHATYHQMLPGMKKSIIGKPLDHMGIVIVDEEGNLCPIGMPGEIWVTGASICLGYVNNNEMNEKKIIEKSFFDQKSQRFYKSGDMAILHSDGLFEYLGRIDDQIKINGHRVELLEIAGALKKIKSIDEAYISKIQMEDGSSCLIGYYIARYELDEYEIIAKLKLYLPQYAIPSFFVYLDSFPITVNGKIDRFRLPYPKIKVKQNIKDIHEIVKSAWCETLNINTVQSDSPFFELGGNSLKAITLVANINAKIKQKNNALNIVDIFRYPSLNDQINLLKERLEGEK